MLTTNHHHHPVPNVWDEDIEIFSTLSDDTTLDLNHRNCAILVRVSSQNQAMNIVFLNETIAKYQFDIASFSKVLILSPDEPMYTSIMIVVNKEVNKQTTETKMPLYTFHSEYQLKDVHHTSSRPIQ